MNLSRTRYEKFAGVDFSTDAAKIESHRAAFARNLISDSGGYPEKRVGYRKLLKLDSRINGIYKLGDKFVIHAGTNTYIWDGEGEPTLALSGLNDDKSFGLEFRKKLYILTGKEFLVFDGESIKHVHDIGYAPLVMTGMTTTSDNYGNHTYTTGDPLLPINLITGKRRVGIKIPPTTDKILRFHTPVKDDSVVLYRGDNKTPIDPNNYRAYCQGNAFVIECNFTLKASEVGDDYIVEYEAAGERVEKNRKIIEECKFMAVYENRLFLSGNPNYPSSDFYCELNDPTYFTDIAYTSIGTPTEAPDEDAEKEREENSKSAEILGYSHIGNYLAVHKDNSSGGASIYLRSASLTDEGMLFPILEGINGSPITSAHTCCTLIDDPLFVTRDGVFALTTENITQEKCVTPRGSRVANRLTKENLKDAVACTFDGYYMVFVGGNVYLADARQKAYARNITNEFEYEWYFWDNVPARCVNSSDALLFGCEDGRICRFNTDIKDKAEAYSDDGEAIVAEWTTRMDDFGAFGALKRINRRGSGVYVKSYPIVSNIEIRVRTERDFGETVAETYRGIMNFENIDFEHFTFNTSPYGFVNFERKIKDFRMAQITCRNDKLNQPFGIYAIELAFKTGLFAK